MSVRRRKKILPTDLAYRSSKTDKHLKRMQRRNKLQARAIAAAPILHDGPVQPGQLWSAHFHDTLPTAWEVLAVTPEGTVTLRGAAHTAWITSVDIMVRVGVPLPTDLACVIPDTVGSRGEDTPQA